MDYEEDWDNPNPQPPPPRQNAGQQYNGQNSNRQYQSRTFQPRNYNSNDDNRSNERSNRFGQGRGFKPTEQDQNRFPRNGHRQGTDMIVDTEQIRRIIGKGGSKIKELQEQTGTRIIIGRGRDEDFGQTTDVTITGDSDGQQRCKQLIEELTSAPKYVAPPPESARRRTPSPIDWEKLMVETKKYEEAKMAALPPLIKDFYKEDPVVKNMSEQYVEKLRKSKNNIVVAHVFSDEGHIPNPVETFEQAFSHYPDILTEIRKQGFTEPSPIQCQAWPILLSGRDLIGIAQTGTGKTLAFLLPALIHIEGQPVPRSERKGANVLVIAPTRELALQIESEVKKYSYRDIKSVCVYGGGSRRDQMNLVTRGVEIIIATPGRFNDLVQAGVIDISSVTYLVLDEADRMLDMGFEPQIRKTMLDVRPDRQTVMTSATWPEDVRALAKRYMKDPIQVYVGSLDLAAVHSVTQTILLVNEDDKRQHVIEFINSLSDDDKIIIFVGKKSVADDLSADLALAGILCQSIHGDREQCDREQAIDDLKTGEVRILVATDVASRGIDITDVTKIFNYDFPRNIEEYVHRVGRTGRAGKTGEAITLFTRSDWGMAGPLISIMEEANQQVPEELYDMKKRFDDMKRRRQEDRDSGRGDRGGGFRGGGGGRFGGGGRGGGGGGFGGGFGGGGGRRDYGGGGGFGGGGGGGGGFGGGGGGGRRNKW